MDPQWLAGSTGIAGRGIADRCASDAAECAAHGQHVFAAAFFGLLVGLGLLFGVEDHLGLAVAVAQVDKDEAAEIPPAVDPAVQDDLVIQVIGRELAAGVRAAEVLF